MLRNRRIGCLPHESLHAQNLFDFGLAVYTGGIYLELSTIKSILHLKFKNIKENIAVLPVIGEFPSHDYSFFTADIVPKNCAENSSIRFDFHYNAFRGYFAEYLIKGLRISKDEDFVLVLFYLYLNDLLASKMPCIRGELFHLFHDLRFSVGTFIEDTYGITFGSTRSHSSGLFSMDVEKSIEHLSFLNADDIIYYFCSLCYLNWSAVFSNHAIIERGCREKKIDQYYDARWLGYLVLKGEKVKIDQMNLNIVHKKICRIILEERFLFSSF